MPHIHIGLHDKTNLTVDYYESIKRELKRRFIYEYWCDERLKTKNEESTRLTDTHRHWVGRGMRNLHASQTLTD